MSIAAHPKKLGLLLLPLIPLSVLGVVEVVDRLSSHPEITCINVRSDPPPPPAPPAPHMHTATPA